MPSPSPRLAFFLALLAIAVPAVVHGQTFTGDFSLSSGAVYQTAATDESRAVAVDTVSAGGPFIYVTGDSNTFGATVKLSSVGVAVTTAPFISGTTGWGHGVAVDPGGNVWVVGHTVSTGFVNSWVVQKNDANLVLLASSVITGITTSHPVATSIVFDASGNAFVAGYSSAPNTGVDFLVMKYSPSLVVLSSMTLGWAAVDQANAIALDSSGNVLVTGLRSPTGSNDYWTVKLNSSLIVLSSAVYDAGGSDRAYAVTTDPSDNIYVTGDSDVGGGDFAVTTVKYNSSLAQLGVVSYNTGAADSGYGAMFVGTNTLVVVGGSYAGADEDWVILAYDSNLALVSSRTYDSGTSDRAYAVAKGTGTYMYVTGRSYTSPSGAFRTIRMNHSAPAGAGLPAAPSAFAGDAQTTSSILWTWTDNAVNETGYRVMAGAVNVSGELAAGATFWLQSGLSTNTPSGPFFARAFNLAGTADSASAPRTTLAVVPAALAASGVYQTSATLNWTAGGNPAGTVFDLERSTGSGYGLHFGGAATTYFDAYLLPSATHYYRVRALNGDGLATAYASSISVVALPAPPVPGSAGTPAGAPLGVSSVTWSWVLASGATYHNLFRAADNSYLGSSSSGPFVQTALTPNTPYGLRAAGVNLGGMGPLSPSATVYTLAAVPTGAAASSITATAQVVSWSLAGNPGSTVAQLERSTNAVVYSPLTSGAVTSYADADLLGCTTYYYRVRNLNGDGLPTIYASFQGVTANTNPSPPAALTASANAGGTVTVVWNLSPTEGVTGYRLYGDAGTGTVNYGAPLAVLGSTATAFTTGVLTSSAAYTFALRARHRCGVEETTGALAMSGAAATLAAVRAQVKEPDSGKRISGNRVTILGELLSGNALQVLFQYKLAVSTTWLSVPAANINHSNPDFSFPYFAHWDVTVLPQGSYDLRAVAYDQAEVPDPSPSAVRVVVDPVAPDISESQTVDGKVKKDQTVSNGVLSVVETAGAGATDPAVRLTIPAGTVNTATATVSVTANPTITTAAPAGQTLVGSAIKIDLSNGQSALNGTAVITLTYPNTVLFPSLLQIYYLNEATGQWSRDFASTVDTASRTVSGNTPHFSTFALMLGTAFALDLNSVRVYPVPFKPNGPNADEGRTFTTGDPNSGIIFANLAMGSEIKIYTLTGRQVASLDNPTIAGTVRWDARNQDGRDVASGAYFAVITSAGHKSVVKKLVIIR